MYNDNRKEYDKMSLKNSKFKTIFCIMIMALTTCFIPSVKAATATASVDGTEYDTLQEAINNANGKTVTLLKNTTESITIGQDITVTLDLGKYTLTNSVGAHTIINKGILTINGNGVVDNISHGKGALVNNGTATIESGKLTRSMEAGKLDTTTGKRVNGGNSWYVIDNNGANATLTIKGGEVVNTSEYSSLIRNLEASLTVTGGKLSNAFISLKMMITEL